MWHFYEENFNLYLNLVRGTTTKAHGTTTLVLWVPWVNARSDHGLPITQVPDNIPKIVRTPEHLPNIGQILTLDRLYR